MKLIEAAMRNIENRDQAEIYLDKELPGENVNREVEEIFSDNECTVYQDVGLPEVFFINHPGGWSSTDNLSDSFPLVFNELKTRGLIK